MVPVLATPNMAAANRKSCQRSQTALLCALCVVAFIAWAGGEAFVGGSLIERPAGRFVITDEPPEGMTCLAARGGEGEIAMQRRAWNPYPQWRGEKTYHPCKELQSDEHRQWYHFDAEGKTLGHLAQVIAATLKGKDSPLYDPIRDVGNFVIVTNCEKVKVSGKKYHYKLYFRNPSFKPGHLKVERFKDLQKRFPERIIMKAVWGSMAKTPSNKRIFKDRLKLFTGPNHLYYHEDPIEYPMNTIKDCTPQQNMRRRDRVEYQFEKLAPKVKMARDKKQKAEDRRKLKKFKNFLKKQLQDMGEEAAERMEFDELVAKAERSRMAKRAIETEGQSPPERIYKYYPGTRFQYEKLGGNRQGGGSHAGR